MSMMLYKKMNGYSVNYLVKGLVKIGLATAVMVIFLLIGKSYLAQWLNGTLGLKLASTFILIALGAIFYGITLLQTNLPEIRDITEIIRTRLSTSTTRG